MAATYLNLPITSGQVYSVVSQAAMLALKAKRGDVATRSDTNESYMLSTDDPTQLGNWTKIAITSSSGGGGNGFGIFQPPNGTSPSATTADDTLNVSSSDSSITITGTAATKTLDFKVGTVGIAQGGTGQTTQQAAINALTGTQSTGKYLRSDGTNATLASIQSADLPTIALTSDVTGSASGGSLATTVAKIQGTTVSGTTGSGNVVFSASPTVTGTLTATTVTMSGVLTNSVAGASGSGAIAITGSPFTSGTATTNKPQVLIEDATTSTGWSTAGTYFGVNAKTGFTGNLMDLQLNGSTKYLVSSAGGVTSQGSATFVGGISSNNLDTRANNTTLVLASARSMTSANQTQVSLATQTDSSTSGTAVAVAIKPTYNNVTSTNAATDLLINRTQTSVGSGSQKFIDMQIAGSSKASIDNTGTISVADVTITGTTSKLRCAFDASYGMYFREDFIGYQGNVSSTSPKLQSLTANSGVSEPAGGALPIDNGHPGVLKMGTGTTTNGLSLVYGGTETVFGGGVLTYETLIYWDVLSTGTDSYQWRFGFGDTYSGSGDFGNGVYFSYTDGANSGNLVLCAAKSGTRTTTNAAVAPTASAWNKFKIVVAADGSSATFFLNGSSIGTVSSNIPVLAANYSHIEYQLQKLLGTNARNFYVDYVEMYQVFTTAR